MYLSIPKTKLNEKKKTEINKRKMAIIFALSKLPESVKVEGRRILVTACCLRL